MVNTEVSSLCCVSVSFILPVLGEFQPEPVIRHGGDCMLARSFIPNRSLEETGCGQKRARCPKASFSQSETDSACLMTDLGLFTARLSIQGVQEPAAPGYPLWQKTMKLRAMVELVRKWPERARLRCHQNPSELGSALGSIKRFACVMQQASRLAGSVAGTSRRSEKQDTGISGQDV